MQTLTDQSGNGQFSNSAYRHKIQTFSEPEQGLKNKADDLKKSNTKHNIFIDIETLRPYSYRRMGISKESMHHKHLNKSEDSHVRTTRIQLLLQKQIDKSLTVKNSTTSFISVSPENKFRNKLSFRREPIIFAKSLTISAPQGMKAKVDYRRQYVRNRSNRNKTIESYDIKKKVLTHLQQLENDIKVVKAQIENDTQTIKDLQNKIRQKEKQRAELNLMNHKNSIVVKTFTERPTINKLTKNLDNALIKNIDFKTSGTIDNNSKGNLQNNKYPKVKVQHYITVKNENDNFNKNTLKLQQPTKTTRNQVTKEKNSIQNNSLDSHKLNKYQKHNNVTTIGNITEIREDYLENKSKNIYTNKNEKNGLYNDYDVEKIKKNENRLNSVSKGKYDTEYKKMYKNISSEENVPTVSTPSIFDLHEDFETFERFDGEFDWEKFVTSEMYIQIAKNSTAESADFRRMLTDKNTTTPTFVLDPPEPVTSFDEKFWADYFLDPPVTDPREEIVFPPYDVNNTKTSLVPRPGDRKYIPDSLEIGIPDSRPLNLEKSQESELKYNTDNNVRFDYLNNRRMFPDDQYPIIDGRRNMPTLPTFQTTLDPLSYDSIIKDIDRAIEI